MHRSSPQTHVIGVSQLLKPSDACRVYCMDPGASFLSIRALCSKVSKEKGAGMLGEALGSVC